MNRTKGRALQRLRGNGRCGRKEVLDESGPVGAHCVRGGADKGNGTLRRPFKSPIALLESAIHKARKSPATINEGTTLKFGVLEVGPVQGDGDLCKGLISIGCHVTPRSARLATCYLQTAAQRSRYARKLVDDLFCTSR